jgi:hypothetical protein
MPGFLDLYQSETRSPEELEALHKSADNQARSELGAAVELAEIGDVGTIEHLEKELAVIERLDGIIARALCEGSSRCHPLPEPHHQGKAA